MAVEVKRVVINPVYECKFSCTYENISKHVDCNSYFCPILNSREKWIVALKVNDGVPKAFDIERVSRHEHSTNMQYHIFIEDIHGKILYETKGMQDLRPASIKKSVVCEDISIFSSELPEDKLVFKGNFIFCGHDEKCLSIGALVHQELDFISDLKSNLKALYQNVEDGDITFTFANGELKSHKLILVLSSPVFAAMFENNISKSVPIEEFSIHVFESFLMFLYTNEIKDDKWETVLSLYQAADKYQVGVLQKFCSRILSLDLNLKNACVIFILSDMHDDAALKSSAVIFILENFCDIGISDEWVRVVNEYPYLAHEILKKLCPNT